MENIKIFVASSGEMVEERKKCIDICNEVGKLRLCSDLTLEAVKWETDIPSGSYKQKFQAEINAHLDKCDIVIVMFYSKVGKFTFEEYQRAVENDKKVFLYFKTGFSPKNKQEHAEYAKVLDLMEQLENENESQPVEYKTIDEFENKIKNDLILHINEKYPSNTIQKPVNRPTSTKQITQPPTKAIELIGREHTLEQIQSLLSQNDRVLLINGLGGIGKTEVCKKFYWDNHNKFSHIGWIDYTTSIKESLVNQINGLQFSDSETTDQRYIKIRNYLYSLPPETLLIIDNIENIDDKDLVDLSRLPFKVIASSRMSFGELFEEYAIDFLSVETCRELFCRYYKVVVQGSESTYLDKVINLAGQHTLTVELLAKTAQSRGMSVEELHNSLTQLGFSLVGIKEKISTIWHNETEKMEFIKHMENVFKLANVNDAEQYILANLSVLPSLPISKADVREWLGLDSTNDINTLVTKGWLIEKGQNIVMHQAVGEVVRHQLQPDGKCCEKLINSFIGLLYFKPQENPLDKVCYIAFSECILKYIRDKRQIVADLATNLSVVYTYKGELDNSLLFQLKALEIREKILDKFHPALASTYNNLAGIYSNKGDLDNSLFFQSKALEIREKIHNRLHPDLATSYNNLPVVYQYKGDLDNSLLFQKKALYIREKVLDNLHPDLAQSYNNLSGIYQYKGDLNNSLLFQRKALEIQEKVLAQFHPSLASSYNNLSIIYRDKGESENALEYQEKAINILFKNFPNGYPELDIYIDNFAILQDTIKKAKKRKLFAKLESIAQFVSTIPRFQERQ